MTMLWKFLVLCSMMAQAFPNAKLQHRRKTQLYKKARGGGGFGTKKSVFAYAGDLRPGRLTPQRIVLNEDITKPDYWETGVPKSSNSLLFPWTIEVKKPIEVNHMRDSGRLARYILDMAGRAVRPGITTDEIDTMVHDEIVAVGSNHNILYNITHVVVMETFRMGHIRVH